MMARHHSISAACLSLAIGRAIGIAPPELLTIAGVATGAALLPDIDEAHSSVAHILEPISGIVARITNRLAGGHRMITHSLFAVGVTGVVVWILTHFTLFVYHGVPIPASSIVVMLCLTLTIRGLLPLHGLRVHFLTFLFGAIATWLILVYVGSGPWLLLAVTGGYFAHLLGDWLTVGGIPLLWPVTRRHFSWPILAHTDSWRERIVGIGLFVLAGAMALSPVLTVVGRG